MAGPLTVGVPVPASAQGPASPVAVASNGGGPLAGRFADPSTGRPVAPVWRNHHSHSGYIVLGDSRWSFSRCRVIAILALLVPGRSG